MNKIYRDLQVWWFKYNNLPLHLIIPTVEDLRVMNEMDEILGGRVFK